MGRNNAEKVRTVLGLYTDDDDVTIEWNPYSRATPIDDDVPEKLVIKSVEGFPLATLFTLEDGMKTVFAALGTNASEFKRQWPNARHSSKLRVRRRGNTFEIRSAM